MIDPQLQRKLRVQYNPDGSKVREAQLAILEILKYVDEVCRQNGLYYWLSSGTLLGAIRHGGFIPWDDDIDIEMPLKDYRKLRKIIMSNKNAPYVWQDHSTDRDYWVRFAKIRKTADRCERMQRSDKDIYDGLYIDVFPVEKMVSRFSSWSNVILNNGTHRINHSNSRSIRRLAELRYAFGSYFIIPIMRFLSLLGYKNKYHLSYGIYFCKPRPLTTLYDTQDWLFEGHIMRIPKAYDAYLTGLYGESYHELPPIEVRKTHGNID